MSVPVRKDRAGGFSRPGKEREHLILDLLCPHTQHELPVHSPPPDSWEMTPLVTEPVPRLRGEGVGRCIREVLTPGGLGGGGKKLAPVCLQT